MFSELTFEELKDRKDLVWIDVRSEGEFEESMIPGSFNVPLFNNEERAKIGTIYKQASPDRARWVGLEIASQKLPALVKAVIELTAGKTPVIYCWRGGMRSKTVATILDLMGISAIRLTGGYRGYRQYVTGSFESMKAADLPPLIVIHGMTGVGKTTLLRLLAGEGEPVLDLEGLARHRGSVFGGIGLNPANQRQFDSLLYDELQSLRGKPYLLMEAESKRVGRVTVPDFLMDAKKTAINVELVAPISVRIMRTLDQYKLADDEAFHESVERAIIFIQKRFSPDLRQRVYEWLDARAYEPLIGALLEEYYDPRYEYARRDYERPFLMVDATNLHEASAHLRNELLRIGQVS